MFSSYLTQSLVCPAAAGDQDQDDSHPLPPLHVCHPPPPGGVPGTEGSGGGPGDVDGEIHLTPGWWRGCTVTQIQAVRRLQFETGSWVVSGLETSPPRLCSSIRRNRRNVKIWGATASPPGQTPWATWASWPAWSLWSSTSTTIVRLIHLLCQFFLP